MASNRQSPAVSTVGFFYFKCANFFERVSPWFQRQPCCKETAGTFLQLAGLLAKAIVFFHFSFFFFILIYTRYYFDCKSPSLKTFVMQKDKYSQPNAVLVGSVIIILLAAIAIALIMTGYISNQSCFDSVPLPQQCFPIFL